MSSKRIKIYFLKLKRKFAFTNKSITFKLIAAFSIVFSIMVLLSYVTFTNYKNDKEATTQSIISQMNSQSITKIDDCINDLYALSKFPLLLGKDEQKALFDALELFNKTNIVSFDLQKSCGELAIRSFQYKSGIHSIFLFNLNGKSEYRATSSVKSFTDFNPKTEQWFQESINGYGKPIMVDTFALNKELSSGNSPEYVFSIARGIVDVNESRVIGIILVNYKLDFLAELCNKMMIMPNQKVIIVDNAGKVVYSKNHIDIGRLYDNELLKILDKSSSKTQIIKLNGVQYLISYAKSTLNGWRIVNIIPCSELYKSIDQIRNTTAVITSVLILIALLFFLVFSSRITKPLKKLVLLMNLVKTGDFDVKIKLKNDDEVGQLAKTFNSMTRRIKKLIDEVYLDKLKHKELEVQMLQNQINPHFLYNTLESIHMMATINKDKETSKMVRALGRILRYGISRNQDSVPVYEEIEHLKDYIMLQCIRFNEIFEIILNIDESINNCHIIKLILQPVVENAIYHGLEMVESGGKITVSGFKNHQAIVFEVNDNGVGMDSVLLQKLNDYINDMDNSFKSIGLKNVNKRIKLHYGDEFGVKVFSETGVGTTVKITVPYILLKETP